MASQKYYNQVRKDRGCEKLGITSNQWSYIKRLGTILRQLYEKDCNGFCLYVYKGGRPTRIFDEVGQASNDRKVARLEKTIFKFVNDNKLHLYLQPDCRGATIYLDTQPIPDSNYTRAICIY